MKVVLLTPKFFVTLVVLVGITAGLPSAYAGLYGAYFGGIPDDSASGGAGVLLGAVKPGSPADDAGLQAGDVILEFDGVRIEDDDHLINQVSLTPIGKEVALRVFRSGNPVTVQVRVRARTSP